MPKSDDKTPTWDFTDQFIRVCVRNTLGENVYALIKPRDSAYATQEAIKDTIAFRCDGMQMKCHMLGYGKDIDERHQNSYWAWLDLAAWPLVAASDDLIEIGVDRVMDGVKSAAPPQTLVNTGKDLSKAGVVGVLNDPKLKDLQEKYENQDEERESI